ncbi:ComEC/Rec2 family competence protein [bacterium]|nr:ComEC/Rec2 family competence protein [bacterium]
MVNRFIILLAAVIFCVSVARDVCIKEEKPETYTVNFVKNLQKRLEKSCRTLENSEFLLALSTGKRDFSQKFRNALSVTGTMHLVAISAFHTGVMILIFGVFFKTLLFFAPLRHHIKNIILFLLKTAASLYYFLITGASIPTLRSLAFVLLLDCFIISGGYPHSVFIFFLSLAAVSLFIPGSTLSLSFFMSALCVATVIRIWRFLPRSSIISIICVSVSVNYVLLAVSGGLTGTFSVFSPFVNFFVIPTVALSVPFVTLAQFLIPFSEILASGALKIADFMISPASFLIMFFAGPAERTAVPVVSVPLFVKVVFVSSFFAALYFDKKIKYLAIFINVLSALLFFFPVSAQEELKRSAAFDGKVFCIRENFSSGRLFFDGYSRNPSFNGYFYSQIERFSAECGITEVLSLHFPEAVPESEKNRLRKKIRFKNAKFYSRE